MITVNMAKARDIQRDKMRAARKPIMEKLDVEFMRAVEAHDIAKQGTVVGLKNLLRDVTADPAIEAAKTPEELKAVWPSVLDDLKSI